MSNNTISIIVYGVILSLGPGLPLLLSLSCSIPALWPGVRYLLPWASVPALLTPFVVPADIKVHVPWFFMGGRMGLDATGRIFLCTAAFVWLLASLAGVGRPAAGRHGRRFTGYFLAAMAGNLGLILARDMLGFYLFFALMSLAAYGLVVHDETPDAKRAGRIYLIMVIIGEVAMFVALSLLAGSAKSTAIADITGTALGPAVVILLFVGFGVKTGAFPFHFWMPLAYQAAPVAAAAALAGAMVNAGLLGWLRFLPAGQSTDGAAGLLFIAAGAFSAFYGVVMGLGQKETRAVLAYSSMSQMGLMTVIFGFGLMAPGLHGQAIAVLTLYMVHHSLAKSSLFLGVPPSAAHAGAVQPPGHRTTGLLLPALALAGLPLTSGAIAKTAFKELAVAIGGPWLSYCEVFLPAASIATTILVLHFLRLHRRTVRAEIPQATGGLSAWRLSLVAVAVALWLWPTPRMTALHSLAPLKIWHSLWPVAAGGCLLFCLNRFAAEKDTFYSVPAGDLLAWAGQWADRQWQELADAVADAVRKMAGPFPSWRAMAEHFSHLSSRFARGEKIMGRWTIAGLFYLMLCIILLVLLLSSTNPHLLP